MWYEAIQVLKNDVIQIHEKYRFNGRAWWRLWTTVVLCCQTAFYRDRKNGEQLKPFLFYRYAVCVGNWSATDSNKELYIGKNDVKKVETTRAVMIQWFKSCSLLFVDEVQAVFWLHALFVTSWPKNHENCKT